MTPIEAVLVTAICFGWAIIVSLQSAAAWTRPAAVSGASTATAVPVGYSDAHFISIIATEVLLSAVAFAFLAWRRYDLPGLYPHPTVRGIGEGIGLYAVGVLAYWLLVAVLQSSPSQEPIQAMVRGTSVSTAVLVAMAVVNGAYEEIFLLGVLSRGLRGYGASIAVGLPLLVRLLYHLYQGPMAASAICILGLLWGLYYHRARTLFPVVFAHIVADVVPFVWR